MNKFITSSRRNRIKSKRLSSKRVFFSKPEIKHTNSKAIITLFVFNKKQSFFRKKILSFLNKNLIKKKSIYKSSNKKSFNNNLYLLNKCLRKVSVIYLYLLNNNFTQNNINIILYRLLKHKFIFKHIKKILYYNQILFLESSKVNSLYINFRGLGIIKLIQEVYDKNIEIDIVNQKINFFNSDIISNSITFKAKDRNKNILKILKKTLAMINLPSKYLFLTNDKINNSKTNTLETLKYKSISGIKIKASGRLTRRLTALRAISKVRNKGGLQNIDSSYKNKSSSISRGYLKSNLQLSQLNAKTRNGAFGLTC